ncbi:MAG: class I SAM-dependent RNA methyltransferase [Clostridiaceae bacterium]
MDFRIVATTTFGIEKVLKNELRDLGYWDLTVENGRVLFTGNERDIVRCNINLRCADRIYIEIARFKAESFEELFQGTTKINFGDLMPENANMHIVGKSVKSKLFSVSDCQAIVKKAMIESMKRKYKIEWFEENGPKYKIEISMLKDIATLNLDTSGLALHKRGYRKEAGTAPLKETLAASLVLLSNFDKGRILADPFCGSGTIPIEAALIAKNIAPGVNRNFAAEEFDFIDNKIWQEERDLANSKINDDEFRILASDIDGGILKTARENAILANVSDYISFQTLPMEEFKSKKKYGVLISNPPYGERIGEAEEVQRMYRSLGNIYKGLDEWSFYVLTSNLIFEKLFGKKSDKNRKLYNGKILCYYYQYINNPQK